MSRTERRERGEFGRIRSIGTLLSAREAEHGQTVLASGNQSIGGWSTEAARLARVTGQRRLRRW